VDMSFHSIKTFLQYSQIFLSHGAEVLLGSDFSTGIYWIQGKYGIKRSKSEKHIPPGLFGK
jgi:hypothetical protein